MVCLACLVPIFLVPIVNLLPLLFHYLLEKFYEFMEWEYRKPVRPLSCPYMPVPKNEKETEESADDAGEVSQHEKEDKVWDLVGKANELGGL